MSTTLTTRYRAQQLALLCESAVPLPLWCNLPQPIRAEVVRNLARLLRSVHERRLAAATPNRGEQNE